LALVSWSVPLPNLIKTYAARALNSRAVRSLDDFARKHALSGDVGMANLVWTGLRRIRAKNSRVETARTLVGEGRFDDAFAMLLAEIRIGGRAAQPAIDEYRRYCTWLGKGGYFQQVRARYDDLKAAGVKEADEYLVTTWSERSVLDPDNVQWIERFLTERHGNASEAAALRLLFMMGQADNRVLDAYDAAFRRGNRAILDDYLGVLAVLDPARCRQLLAEQREALNKGRRAVSLDLLLARETGPLGDVIAERERTFALRLAGTQEQLLKRLADPSLRIAVVGNSPIEKGRGLAAEIDAHDIVIRFNRASVPPEARADYGETCDILVANYSVVAQLAANSDLPVVVTGKDWEVFTLFKPALMALSEHGVDLMTVPRPVRVALNKALRATASSGIQILAMLADLRGSLEGVGVYGFSLVDQVGTNPTSANYFRSSRAAANHNWRGEALILEALRKGARPESVAASLGGVRYQNQWKTYETFKPIRIRLEGDHSDYHCGSEAVTRSLLHHLAPVGVVVEDGDFDAVVVNGEGTMHSNSVGFNRKMKLLEKAMADGKAAYLVNTVWQNNPNTYDHVLAALDGIHVREIMSRQELAEKHGIHAKLYPDLSYYAPLKKAKKRIDYKGSIVMTDFYSNEFQAFMRMTRAEALKYPFVDMMSVTWDDLVASLKTSKLLITGRHHAVYAACKAETPFIAFGGNTHKIEGIFRSAGVEIPVCESRAAIPEMIKWAKENRATYDRLFAYLKSQKPWRL
jgi:hypothetical protein